MIWRLIGPLGGYAMKIYGIRPVMMAGVCLVVAMFVVTAAFPSVWMLGFCYAGLGLGSQQAAGGAAAMVQYYFDKRRSFATGIIMSGVSSGIFLWPPIVRLLIDEYTWKGSFYILAGVYAQCTVLSALLRPSPTLLIDRARKINMDAVMQSSANGNRIVQTEATPSETGFTKFKYITCFLYIVCYTAQVMGHMAPMNFYPLKAHQNGIDKQQIPFIISAIGGVGIFMRALAGYISDRFINRLNLAAVSLVICGIAVCLSTLIQTFPPFLALGVFIGVLQSLYMGTAGAQMVDVFGLQNVELGMGLSGCATGLATLIMNPAAGALVDATGNTNAIFLVFGSVQILSGLLLWTIKRLLRCQNSSITIVKDIDDSGSVAMEMIKT